MANLTFIVQSLSSAGPDRVAVNLTQLNSDSAQPFFGSNLSLNLPTADAKTYEINAHYTITLTATTAS